MGLQSGFFFGFPTIKITVIRQVRKLEDKHAYNTAQRTKIVVASCFCLFPCAWSAKTWIPQLKLHMVDNPITRDGIGVLGSSFLTYSHPVFFKLEYSAATPTEATVQCSSKVLLQSNSQFAGCLWDLCSQSKESGYVIAFQSYVGHFSLKSLVFHQKTIFGKKKSFILMLTCLHTHIQWLAM